MAGPTGEFRVINLTARKLEHEWASAWQAGVERAKDAWFTWIRWLFVCGALAYLAERTGSALVGVLAWISELMIWMYFIEFFNSIRIEPLTTKLFQSDTKTAKFGILLMALILSSIGTLGMRELIEHVIELLKVARPLSNT